MSTLADKLTRVSLYVCVCVCVCVHFDSPFVNINEPFTIFIRPSSKWNLLKKKKQKKKKEEDEEGTSIFAASEKIAKTKTIFPC